MLFLVRLFYDPHMYVHIYLNNTHGEGQTPGLRPAPKLLLPVLRVVWPRHVTLGPPKLSHTGVDH